MQDFRHALREVARSCLHGVDRNPMAVELTKVALWIETVDPGLPLGFFDAQIRCGNPQEPHPAGITTTCLAISADRPAPLSSISTIDATTRACRTSRRPTSTSGAARPSCNNEKESNGRPSKPGACFTANPPHDQTNQMSQTLSWIRPTNGPKTLTTDKRR